MERKAHRVDSRQLLLLSLCTTIVSISVGKSPVAWASASDECMPFRRCLLWETRMRNHNHPIIINGKRSRNHPTINNGNGNRRCATETAFLHHNRKFTNLGRGRLRKRRIPTPDLAWHAYSRLRIKNDGVDDGVTDDEDATKKNEDRFRPRSKGEWIDGRQMKQILAREKEEERRRKQVIEFEQQMQMRARGDLFQNSNEPIGQSSNLEVDKSNFVSRISYTDANTLQIDIPSPGIDANSFATGAFSALWFSAVAPATVSMLGAGLLPTLFMAPFWLAGGVVAKSAVYDPFISSSLSIGQYLWTLEKRYLKSNLGSLKTKKEEGPTQSLSEATVELAMVVNNVGQYQLRLFFEGNNDSLTFGKGLAREELEDLSRVINGHCATLGESS